MDVLRPYVRLQKTCAASPEVVYDLLADLRTHRDWGGTRQRRIFRLETLNAPDGPATAGTVFTSTGLIPMSGRRWHDRSTVSIATRPAIFEFVTEAEARGGRGAMVARYLHRYEIAAVRGGSSVTYTFVEVRVANPMLRFAVPGVRTMTRLMASAMLAKGFRNLLAAAETRSASQQVEISPALSIQR